jgi:hypothetical protein
VFTPSGPNRPTPHRPRPNDDWIAVLVALGVLGGLGGWLIAGGFAPVDIGQNGTAVVSEGSSQPPTGDDLNAAGTPNESRRASPDGRDRAPSDRSSPPSAAPTTTSAAPPSDDAPPDTAAVPTSPAPEAAPSLTVPDPQIPNSDRAERLPVTRSALPFTDVPEGYWAKPYIDALTARGVLNGLPEGGFEPNRPMTRAELAAQVTNAFDFEPVRVNKAFQDVAADDWAHDPIQQAFTRGFMTGYPEGDFRPNETVSRQQVVVALATGLSLPTPDAPDTWLQSYADQGDIPAWAREQVAAAIAAQLIAASPVTNNRFRPRDAVTRAEVATLVYNALVYMGQVEPIE